MRVDRRLHVAGDDVRARVNEGLHLLQRVGDHQVTVLDEAARDRLYNRRPDCELRAEHAVHDIDVHYRASCLFEERQILPEPQQVRGQHSDADRGSTVQQLPDGGSHFALSAIEWARSWYASKASWGFSPSCTTLPTAWIMATGDSDWKMLRPMSTPAAPSWMAR